MSTVEILRAFAERAPLQRSDDEDHCVYCGVSSDDYLEERDTDGAFPYREVDYAEDHLPTCPWRAAVEYVATLEQEIAQ